MVRPDVQVDVPHRKQEDHEQRHDAVPCRPLIYIGRRVEREKCLPENAHADDHCRHCYQDAQLVPSVHGIQE